MKITANADYGKKMTGKKSKKAQMKIQQMAFMLIAITLFFVLVGIFFIVIKVSELKGEASALEEENALLLVTKLANSPEFSCGESFGVGRVNCVDADKMMILRENADKYLNFWQVSNIEIRKIYPLEKEVECTIGNYPDCNVIKLMEKEITMEHSNFVSLCRKDSFDGSVYDRCEIAKLMISYENK